MFRAFVPITNTSWLIQRKQLILFLKNSNVTHGEAEDEDLRLLLRKEVILDLHSSAVKSFSMPKQTCVAWEGKTRGRKEELKTFLLALPVISLLRFPCKLHLFGKERTPNVWKKELQKRHFCLKWFFFPFALVCEPQVVV